MSETILPILQKLRDVLLAQRYTMMCNVPSRRRLLALAYDPVNLLNYILGKRNTMNQTALPGLYAAISRARGLGRTYQLYEMFQMQKGVPTGEVERWLGAELLKNCIRVGLMCEVDGKLVSNVRISPLSVDRIVFSDMNPTVLPVRPAHGVYIGRDSFLLLEWLRRHLRGRRFKASLDLCSGTGIQTMLCAEHADRALGCDIRPTAVEWAGWNVSINDISNIEFVASDLFSEINGRFDLVTANFPYDYGQDYGIKIAMKAMLGLNEYLEKDGEFFGTTLSWVDSNGTDVLEEAMRSELAAFPMEVDLIPANYCLNYQDDAPERDRRHLEKTGIRKGIQYFIRVKKKGSGDLTFRKHHMAWPRAIFWNVYVQALRALNRR